MFIKKMHIALAAIAAFVVVVFTGQAANAHDRLVETNPAHNETVNTSITEIVLTYNNELLNVAGASLIELRDSADKTIQSAEPEIDKRDAKIVLETELEPGAYRVVWRVVSSDGHPIEGSFNFAVGENAAEQLASMPAGVNLAANALQSEQTAADPQSDNEKAEITAKNNSANSTGTNDNMSAASDNAKATSPGAYGVVLASVGALAAVAVVIAVIVWWQRQNKKQAESK